MTLGANVNVGMDMNEFAKYLFLTVAPLYIDMADILGKCVAIISFYRLTELT